MDEQQIVPLDMDPRVSRTLALKNLFFDKGTWQAMELMCTTFVKSGALPTHVNNPAKAIVLSLIHI